jgi:hypothetical protein
MILGVLSDTHGRYQIAEAALGVLREAGATAFVHCGDVGDERVFDVLAGEQCWFVWGNTDLPSASLRTYIENIGLTGPRKVPLTLKLDERRIAVCHGHEREFDQLMRLHQQDDVPEPLRFDFLLHGHTHIAAHDCLPSGMQRLNPGALHRAKTYTVATIDLPNRRVAHWVVDPHFSRGLRSFSPEPTLEDA